MRTAALALVSVLLPARLASACHHFRYWGCRTPQRCSAVVEPSRHRIDRPATHAVNSDPSETRQSARPEGAAVDKAGGGTLVLPSLDDEAERRAEALKVLQEKLMELK